MARSVEQTADLDLKCIRIFREDLRQHIRLEQRFGIAAEHLRKPVIYL